MTSEVAICNLALGRIGIDKTIASLTEQSKEARNCARFYEHCRDLTLSDGVWPFAVKTVALALLSNTGKLGGWGYQYQKPSDALRILELTTEDEVTQTASAYTDCCGPWLPYRGSGLYAFRMALAADGNTQVILSNLETPYAAYVSRVTNPEAFSTWFVEALVDRLAVELATPLTADPRWTQLAMTRAQVSLANAQAVEYDQSKHGPAADAPSIRARN